jgi:CubicO group peptidase (beta-lactamase class C family)
MVGTPTPLSTLKMHVADTFRVNLRGGVFVYGHADQVSADVIVEIYSPDGRRIGSFDGPARGHESFNFITSQEGVHRIVVAPFNENSGDYTLLVRGAEPKATDPGRRIEQIIKSLMEPGVSPGLTVAVQQDGKIVYSQGFGYANLEYNIENTPATIFHVASVSKQFTAFAIAMLADQGKLKLTDDIRKYLPELHDFGPVITIDHLIHHTSGLRDQWSLLMMAGWRLDDVITDKQIMRLVSKQKELNFSPGDEMLYCNTGFTLLAEIVNRVTGESFADWTKKNIFEPLQMKRTLFYVDHEMIVENRAYSYYQIPGGYKKSVLSFANAGATSLFTTVEDLSRWAVNFEKMTVGNSNVMEMMKQCFVLNNGDTIRYAFGQAFEKYKGLNSYSHGGADAGYRSHFLRFPDQHFSVSVFSNLASFVPAQISYELAGVYLDDEFMEEEKREVPPPPAAPEEPAFDPASVILTDFVGTYYSPELETNYTLTVVNDTLTARHQRHDDIKVSPVRTDGFQAAFLGTLQFTRGANRQITGFKASNGRVRNLVFNKE